MSALVKPVRDALISLLTSVDGSGSYTVDLSGGDNVGTGFRDDAPVQPYVEVHFLNSSVSVEEFVSLRHSQTWLMIGTNDATAMTSAARVDAADALLSDCMLAIEGNWRLDSLGIDSDIEVIHCRPTSYAAYDGQVYNSAASYGRAEMTVQVEFLRELGVR